MTAALLFTLVLLQPPAAQQGPPLPQATEADYVIKDFKFTSGETLPELRIHYRTLGTPRKDAQGIVTQRGAGHARHRRHRRTVHRQRASPASCSARASRSTSRSTSS